jgi:hypothetical protein
MHERKEINNDSVGINNDSYGINTGSCAEKNSS